MKCSNHPRYRGVRKSTTGCLKCKLIFGLRRIASACGFAVVQSAPRKIKFQSWSEEFPGIIEGVDSKPLRYECDDARPGKHRKVTLIGGPRHGQTGFFPPEWKVFTTPEGTYRERDLGCAESFFVIDGMDNDAARASEGVTNYDKGDMKPCVDDAAPPDSGGKV